MSTDEPRGTVEAVIPLAEERVVVSKHEVEAGKVRVTVGTDVNTVIARATLRGSRIEVERVPVHQVVPDGSPAPQSRQEGDTLIVPVIEEVAVVVKRLMVVEEVHLHFVAVETPFEEEVVVRREKATVERVEPDEDLAAKTTGAI